MIISFVLILHSTLLSTSCIVSFEEALYSQIWQNTHNLYALRQLKTVEDEERCVVNTISESTQHKSQWAALIFERF